MNPAAHKEIPDRLRQAAEALRRCRLCPRDCRVDRTAGQRGFCGLDDSACCYREMLHWGEEQELIPSHQIYFAGCNLNCQYCTVSEWNEQPEAADDLYLPIDELVTTIARHRREGAKTLNLLGGEPAVSVAGILALLGRVDPHTQVVWNSNMYYHEPVGKLMRGLADIYLADFKCGNDVCALSLLGAPNYTEVIQDNLRQARAHADLIVRHLVLPGHRECCLEPILRWLADTMPEVKVSLRGDYVPPPEAGSAPRAYLQPEELKEALNMAEKLGLNLIR